MREQPGGGHGVSPAPGGLGCAQTCASCFEQRSSRPPRKPRLPLADESLHTLCKARRIDQFALPLGLVAHLCVERVVRGGVIGAAGFQRGLRGQGGQAVWAASGSIDTDLGSLSLLKLYRTDVAER